MTAGSYWLLSAGKLVLIWCELNSNTSGLSPLHPPLPPPLCASLQQICKPGAKCPISTATKGRYSLLHPGDKAMQSKNGREYRERLHCKISGCSWFHLTADCSRGAFPMCSVTDFTGLRCWELLHVRF